MAEEGANASLSCPFGSIILGVDFASYGTPFGFCPAFTVSACHAVTSAAVVAAACVGETSCVVPALNASFGGSPCCGVPKELSVVVRCGPPSWCASVPQNSNATLACPPGSVITAVTFASYGTPTGVCRAFSLGTCNAESSVSVVAAACVGHRSCTVNASDALFGGDPCVGVTPMLSATVSCGAPAFQCASAPDGGNATLACPLQGSLVESIVFASYGTPTGACLNYSVGDCSAEASVDVVTAACLGSPNCTLAVTDALFEGDPCPDVDKLLDVAVACGPPVLLCANADENEFANLTCNTGFVISGVDFASFGTPTGDCPSYAAGDCDAGTSNAVVVAACVGLAGCSINATSSVFGGDPCDGTSKSLAIAATCALADPTTVACATADEDSDAALSCPVGYVVSSIDFASYGTPTGDCPAFSASSCNATTSVDIVSEACLGLSSCVITASNDVFDEDPCCGVIKNLAIAATCAIVA